MYSSIKALLLYREIKRVFPEARILTKEEAFNFKIKDRLASLKRSITKQVKTENSEAQPATAPSRMTRRCSRGEKRLMHVDQLETCFGYEGGRK